MNGKQLATEMMIRKWASDMAEQKSSGMSRREWCERHNISLSGYDYRCRKVKETLAAAVNENTEIVPAPVADIVSSPAPVFTKISMVKTKENNSGINIRLGTAEINIAPDSNIDHIKIVMEALAYAK